MKKKKKSIPAQGNTGTILRIASILVAAVGIFWLPWHFGSGTPAVGESYSLGFNNRAGILAFGVSIFLAAAACHLSARRSHACNWLDANPRLFPPWREAPIEYTILLCISLVMAGFLLFWNNYLVDPGWCEARGFIYDMDLVALGQVPYRDFMFNYGPLTLYLPLWLSNISRGLISIEQAYGVSLALFTVGGFVSVFVFLRRLELPKPARPLVLGIAVLVWTCVTMGLQYTSLRFFVVPVSLIVLDAIVRRQGGRGIASFFWTGLGGAVATGACLAISPEMGIACMVAVGAYGFVLLLRRSIAPAVACWLGSAAIFSAMLLAFPGYLDAVFAFSSGGSNFPIYPNLYNLCLVAISLLILSPLIASALADPAEKRAPLALALAVGGGMLLPAAFGRCDPGHVIINSVIPSLMMFPAAAAAGKKAFAIWTGVYAVLFVVLSQVSYWGQYTSNFSYAIKMHQFYGTNPEVVASWKSKWDALRLASPHGADLHWSKVLYFPDELVPLTEKGRILLTSGNEGNLWLARFLLLQKSPPRDYFIAYSQGATTPAQIDRKIQEDMEYQFLVVPQPVMEGLGTIDLSAYQRQISSFLSKLLLFPVNSEVRNPPYLPDTEYVRRILNSYKPFARDNNYVILEKEKAS